MTLQDFLDRAWKDYVRLTPDAQKVHDLLTQRGEILINDHIALRTFQYPGLTRQDLGSIFEGWGYKPQENLEFPEKNLLATYWLHEDKTLPKVFISELLLDQCSPTLQDWIRPLAKSAAAKHSRPTPEILLGNNWEPIRLEDYQRFYPESEYAAWTAAFGLRANHFTVLFNSLKTFATLQELNEFLAASGFTLNQSGGIIKGTPSELLEQSSTMARKIPWHFADSRKESIPGCYYEFARRYPLPGTRELFPGFIPKSADKIFESTFEKNGNSR